MSFFHITLEWLEHQSAKARGAASVTLPGDEMRELLAAARKGLGYPPAPADVSEYVPADNPNWRRFQLDRQRDAHEKSRKPPYLRLVDK